MEVTGPARRRRTRLFRLVGFGHPPEDFLRLLSPFGAVRKQALGGCGAVLQGDEPVEEVPALDCIVEEPIDQRSVSAVQEGVDPVPAKEPAEVRPDPVRIISARENHVVPLFEELGPDEGRMTAVRPEPGGGLPRGFKRLGPNILDALGADLVDAAGFLRQLASEKARFGEPAEPASSRSDPSGSDRRIRRAAGVTRTRSPVSSISTAPIRTSRRNTASNVSFPPDAAGSSR